MNCNGSGRLHFVSCYNCTIEGITWEGCGARNIILNDDDDIYPVFQLTDSYNLTIQNCSFQHSIGQAIVLSRMSGDVNINYCNFLYNNEYEGHGMAIHYSSNNILTYPPIIFIITGCNYFYNGRAKSIVYFSKFSTKFKVCEYFKLQDSKFIHNKEVPVYLSNQDLHINGNVEFSNNVAEDGGGIFISDHSNVIFHKSATVNFTNNRATNNGGAIFLSNHSSILFKDHFTSHQCFNELYNILGDRNFTIVTFYQNTADQLGQDIYAHISNITVGDHATVALHGSGQDYHHNSGAIYAEHYSTITFEGNSKTTCNDYWAESNGGAVYVTDCSTVTFKENSTATFNNNRAENGGAVYTNFSTITFEGNSTVTFSDISSEGGAVYFDGDSVIKFEGNCMVTFNNNIPHSFGGAMYADFSTITFKGNSKVMFANNTADHDGGAVSIESCDVSFEENSTITFNNNEANSNVGAVYIESSNITLKENSVATLYPRLFYYCI